MVDSRAKGQRGEYLVRDLFRKHTGLEWERVPGSGMFGKQHSLKGDLYVPNTNYIYCVEVKAYSEDVISSNLLNDSVSQLEKFWQQTEREAAEISKEPLLVFKKDRGKWLVACKDFEVMDAVDYSLAFNTKTCAPLYITLLQSWLSIKRKYVHG